MITPKNWHTFQHYTKRNPPWIKLHRALLDDPVFQCLPVASRALAPMLWLQASTEIDGGITFTSEQLAFRFRMTHDEFLAAFKPLVDNGFFVDASGVLASCKQSAMPETETKSETKSDPVKSKKAKKELDPIPAELLPFLEELKAEWPRRSSDNPKRQVTILRPIDSWAKIQANRGTDDPKIPINAALHYLEGKPTSYVIGMDNFFGREKKYTKYVVED